MDLDRLRRLLPKKVAKDVDQLWSSFRQQAGAGADTSTFAAHLHEQGLITNEHLREVLTSTDVSLTLSEAVRRPGGPGATSTRYRLLGLLGKGAMGEVHIARDVDLHRNVALKRIDPGIAHDERLAARFHTEVQITAQLDHPGIVPVYGLEEDGSGLPAYAMKLIRGRTLEDFVADTRAFHAKGKRPDEDHALPARLEIFLRVCDAMAYAHARGVIHRDLKPENIMVGSYGQIVVMDWGIARVVGGEEPLLDVQLAPGRAAQTQLGLAIGTPAYMSPEQARGLNDELDARSDQYALGLILFELVSLKRAITGNNAVMVLTRAAMGEREPLVHAVGERIPVELAAIVAKATARKPKDRYADVDALADDVRRFLRDEAVLARPDRALQRVTRWISHHRQATLGVVLSLVGLVVAVAVVLLAGGVAAFELSRWSAAVREEKLGQITGVVNRQAHRMDGELQRYESLLTGLAFAAEHVLQDEPRERPVYLSPQYAVPEQAPPDLVDSARHDGKVSLDHVDLTLAPGLPEADAERRLWQLASLRPDLENVLLRSASDEATGLPPTEQVTLVTTTGTPAIWAYVATEEGILAAYPGIGGYPEGYDPRERPWYLAAKAARGARWGEAYVDPSGAGLVVPCSMGLRDEQDRFLGIAGMDVTVGFLVDNLLDPPELAGTEAYLVNPQGKVVVQSSLKEKAMTVEDFVPPPFPWPVVRERVAAGEPSGHLEVDEDGTTRLLAWSHLESVDWTYVIVGGSDDLLAAW